MSLELIEQEQNCFLQAAPQPWLVHCSHCCQEHTWGVVSRGSRWFSLCSMCVAPGWGRDGVHSGEPSVGRKVSPQNRYSLRR